MINGHKISPILKGWGDEGEGGLGEGEVGALHKGKTGNQQCVYRDLQGEAPLHLFWMMIQVHTKVGIKKSAIYHIRMYRITEEEEKKTDPLRLKKKSSSVKQKRD